ncbi:MAG: TonB-dependent receptor, partial [Verrucomicrobiaceae bacterium]|nr:TonB-dependent receptor [Verrucomicrobiaceae bacterium]
FGQVSYEGFDRWGFHAGLRLERYEKELKRDAFGVMGPVPSIEDSEDFFFVSPRLGIDYEIDDTSLVYLSTGLTFKPGGFSAFVDDPSIA